MDKPRPWSWSDVQRAKAAEDCRLTVRVDAATYSHLLAMARADGLSVNQLAASLLKAVAEDDAAAHAGDA
ncbi:MAG: hypothetical protein B7Y12_01980 [Rhizobiales bacterium 24-66-13]|jgi:predicted HicB family RNase H-like nuclease|nr:MAG: hypothetical protein B7Y12_01980 [Rhizobiales bacterium 24-66-13]OZB11818.1 MAG: hypothetical protein B7X67_01960 [Rhizobiales bacterium 39-66-18]HQS09511.1 hypothetical protein [Xanthobacteraceae bacterium]HQS46808.1 hypothetical protein [Xanthobacteraceae bacterium]